MPSIRPGKYRAEARDWGVKRGQEGVSKSVSININWLPEEHFNEELGGWEPWDHGGVSVNGDVWIRGREGQWLDELKTAHQVLRWDGDWRSLKPEGSFKPPRCEIEVIEEEWKGVKRLKVDKVRNLDGTSPTSGSNRVGTDELDELEAELGQDVKVAMGLVPPPEDDGVPF